MRHAGSRVLPQRLHSVRQLFVHYLVLLFSLALLLGNQRLRLLLRLQSHLLSLLLQVLGDPAHSLSKPLLPALVLLPQLGLNRLLPLLIQHLQFRQQALLDGAGHCLQLCPPLARLISRGVAGDLRIQGYIAEEQGVHLGGGFIDGLVLLLPRSDFLRHPLLLVLMITIQPPRQTPIPIRPRHRLHRVPHRPRRPFSTKPRHHRPRALQHPPDKLVVRAGKRGGLGGQLGVGVRRLGGKLGGD
mmetsp:Transcript_9902/g.22237  ORF Transcript_9902/g.22237 Transcript_9902/m.22237 type:complete len:243 (-) Transcript_9902:163-891(-)